MLEGPSQRVQNQAEGQARADKIVQTQLKVLYREHTRQVQVTGKRSRRGDKRQSPGHRLRVKHKRQVESVAQAEVRSRRK